MYTLYFLITFVSINIQLILVFFTKEIVFLKKGCTLIYKSK